MAVLCLIISLPYLLVRRKNNSHFTDELNHHFLRQRGGKMLSTISMDVSQHFILLLES